MNMPKYQALLGNAVELLLSTPISIADPNSTETASGFKFLIFTQGTDEREMILCSITDRDQ